MCGKKTKYSTRFSHCFLQKKIIAYQSGLSTDVCIHLEVAGMNNIPSYIGRVGKGLCVML